MCSQTIPDLALQAQPGTVSWSNNSPGFPFEDEVLFDRLSTLLSQLPARQSVPQKSQVVPKQQSIQTFLLCMLNS